MDAPVGQVDPTLFADPASQQKIAENVLTQLGLHPNQQGAKSLLDAHFAGPTAHPEVKEAVANPVPPSTPPLINTTPAKVEGVSNPPKEEIKASPEPTAPAAPAAPATPAANAQPAVQPTAPAAQPSLNIPSPDAGIGRLQTNTQNTTEGAQHELDRLIHTGSGISQIQNPFLRNLARVGDVALGTVLPHAERSIPGTEGHHSDLINNQERLINAGLKQGQQESSEQLANANIQKDQNSELMIWQRENPGKPIDEFWKQKATAQMGKLTPDQQELRFLTTPRDQGGEGMTVDEAYKTLETRKAEGKPSTAKLKSDFQDLMTKMSGGQPLDPALTNDMGKLVKSIGTSDNLTPEEKQKAFAYLVSNNTPASGAYAPQERSKALGQMRMYSAIDTTTGQLAFATPELNAKYPGRYIGAAEGGKSMSKEALFQDINFNLDQTDEAIKNLHTDFDASTRAQLAYVLRSTDPRSSVSSFLQSTAAKSLTPDQIDYVTALASLMENAMAMRSVASMGQGSDELRSAILRALPGPNTPSKEFAQRQLELMRGTLRRIQTGVPKSGVPLPEQPKPKTTQEITNEGGTGQAGGIELTTQQIQAKVDEYNAKPENKDKKITLQQGIDDAKKHGVKIKGEQ